MNRAFLIRYDQRLEKLAARIAELEAEVAALKAAKPEPKKLGRPPKLLQAA